MVGEDVERFVGDVVDCLHGAVHSGHHFRHVLCTGTEFESPGHESVSQRTHQTK